MLIIINKIALCIGYYGSYMEYLLQLIQAEERISRIEDCDCRKSCHVNNSVYDDGATWQNGCELCSCVVSLEKYNFCNFVIFPLLYEVAQLLGLESLIFFSMGSLNVIQLNVLN